jgi:zinc D-Ala-D-Ala carboxypeptidase
VAVIDWTKYPNFTAAEFACRHTGLHGMRPLFMDRIQALRTEYGKPMRITSGYRHPSHPVEARKGHSNGEHTQGMCADIACTSGSERYTLVLLALKHGFHRIGIAKTFLHLGLGGPGLPPYVIWEYQ